MTPSLDLTDQVVSAVSIPVKVMIRNRKGDFEYSAADMEHMHAQLLALSQLNIAGVVFGALKDLKLDIDLV